jgi:aspartyl protease family protein
MWGVIILCVAMAIAVLAWLSGTSNLGGLDLETLMPAVSAMVLMAALVGSQLDSVREEWRRMLRDAAIWIAIIFVLTAGYAFRDDLSSVWARMRGVLVPGSESNAEGEVTISRSSDGQFHARAEIGGKPVRVMFDTGASSVVLSDKDAAALGLRPSDAEFSITVRTANGVTRAAPVILPSLRIGSITKTNVRAMISRPGALDESLLGMTFLEQLSSYEVRGDRLILRDRR